MVIYTQVTNGVVEEFDAELNGEEEDGRASLKVKGLGTVANASRNDGGGVHGTYRDGKLDKDADED